MLTIQQVTKNFIIANPIEDTGAFYIPKSAYLMFLLVAHVI
jgi:hypothetical protein